MLSLSLSSVDFLLFIEMLIQNDYPYTGVFTLIQKQDAKFTQHT